MGTPPAGGGGAARIGGRPPPLLENKNIYIYYMGSLFTSFSAYGGPFSPCGGLFDTFSLRANDVTLCNYVGDSFIVMGGLFWACPPPPRKFLRRPCLELNLDVILGLDCPVFSLGLDCLVSSIHQKKRP